MGCDQESSYLPIVRDFVQATKEYKEPSDASAGMISSLKKKRKSEAGGTGGRQAKAK